MNSFDLRWVMKNAWASYRLRDNQRTFNECLKNAWEIAKKQAACEEKVRTGCCNVIEGNRCFLRLDDNVAATGHNGWIVTGQTYPIRKDLKWMGFKWDPDYRYWYTESADVAYMFVAE